MSAIQDTMIEPPNFAYDWYTPLISSEVKKGKITPLKFMGEDLIVFRNDAGKVIVMDGNCPHFGADLSKGDICDNMIRCPFHGFYFDESGQCIKGDVVKDPSTLEKITLGTWAVEECAGQIFIWHGADQNKPTRPLPIKDIDWDLWTTPVTSSRRTITNSNMCYLTENIIDMQHFDTVHKWRLNELIDGPLVNEQGEFCTEIDVTVVLAAQSEAAWARIIGGFIKMTTNIKFRVFSPGLAIATSNAGTDEAPKRVTRNIVCIYPINEKDVSIRVAVAFQKKPETSTRNRLINAISKPSAYLGALITARIAVSDFDGDLKVWNNRKYLTNPKYVKEDGPMILFRQWYLRFWHEDYMHELTNPVTTGNKIPAIKVAQI